MSCRSGSSPMTMREFLTPLTIALALVLVLATITGFVLIPADTILPVHWGPTGQADRFMPRDGALVLLPGIAALVVCLIVVAAKKSPSDRVAGARSGLLVVVPVILGLANVIQAFRCPLAVDAQKCRQLAGNQPPGGNADAAWWRADGCRRFAHGPSNGVARNCAGGGHRAHAGGCNLQLSTVARRGGLGPLSRPA